MTESPRENKLLFFLEGSGLAILLMVRYLWLHLSPLHDDLYHRVLPMNRVFGGLAIDLLALSLACTLALWLLKRFDPVGDTLAWFPVIWIFVIQACGAVVLAIFSGDIDIHPKWVAVLAAVLPGIAPLLWLWKRRWYVGLVQVLRATLAIVGACIVWMLPQLIYMTVRPEPYGLSNTARAVPPERIPQRRLVWIVFDELSQDQTFDHRQPDIDLPALDRFRSQSVMFSNMAPAGYYTEIVLPSLLWGHVITREESDLSGNFSVKTEGRKWQAFPASESLFADAQRDGWSVGVAGWYNPYCRTYAPYLDRCAWTLRAAIPGNYHQEKSLWWNANAPLLRWESKFGFTKYRPPSSAAIHAADYTDLMQWSHELIDDENIGFVFLHLPLPHPGGFYDRKTGQLGVKGSYIDNLVLTDRTLDQLMQWIGQTKLASKTTIVLCSDHSWRVPLWNMSPMWTAEDARVSQNRFDTRPVLMVHFPEQTSAETVSASFPAIKEHALIQTLLKSPMDADGLKNWAAKQAVNK